jgi:hypothetical protein
MELLQRAKLSILQMPDLHLAVRHLRQARIGIEFLAIDRPDERMNIKLHRNSKLDFTRPHGKFGVKRLPIAELFGDGVLVVLLAYYIESHDFALRTFPALVAQNNLRPNRTFRKIDDHLGSLRHRQRDTRTLDRHRT